MLVLTQPKPDEAMAEAAAATVAARWARAEALGVAREGDAYPVGSSGAELADRRSRMAELLRDRGPMLEPLAATSFCALLADPSGVIVSARAGDGFVSSAARVRLVAGADWSEHARGTNAIGTAIAERVPVAVIGGAHYERRNEALFCYAAPVFDEVGDLAAVIDVTGALADDDPSLARTVVAAAAAVEQAIRRAAYAQAGVPNLAVLERLIERAGGPAFLLESRGPVRVHNDAARRAVLAGQGTLDCQAIFGLDFATLANMARMGQDARFETQRESFRVHLDPVLDGKERALGIVVHLEALRRRSSPPPPVAAAEEPRVPTAFDTIQAKDPAVIAAKQKAATFAATTIPVLLLAETGTGKELFARAIHASSRCAAGPFVAVNCGAVSHALLESELFGYAPGAFTGSGKTGSSGLLGEADGGTLFLDEIAEMPEPLQAALLRALEDGTYRRLGDPRPKRSTFRLVAATCKDLAACVEDGTFRRDLFFRIQGACIRIPAVRQRKDRVALTQALVAASREPPPELAPSAVEHVESHSWPGNVRELKSAVAHALALCGAGPIEREHFPEPLLGKAGPRPSARTRQQILRDAAGDAMRAAGGNVSEAARRLGVARDTLYKMLRNT